MEAPGFIVAWGQEFAFLNLESHQGAGIHRLNLANANQDLAHALLMALLEGEAPSCPLAS